MLPVRYAQTGVGISPWFMPNYHLTPFQLDIECGVSGSVTFNIETTFDDYWTPPNQPNVPWSPTSAPIVRPTTVNAATAAASLILTSPVRGWRVNVTAGTGTVTVEALQSGTVNYG